MMTTHAGQIQQAVKAAALEREFRSAFANLQGRVSKGVYPNLVALLTDLQQFQGALQTGGKFEQFADDPLVGVLNQLMAGETLGKLSEAVAAIEALERATTPLGETQGIFELNLPPLEDSE